MPRAKATNGSTEARVEIPPLSPAEIDEAMRQARAVLDGTATKGTENVVISAPRMATATLTIRGLAPYVQHAFSQKAQAQMEATQRAGSQAKSRRVREARQFEEDYKAAMHLSREGWNGIPATGIRNAMISACRLVGFMMTRAKCSVFIEADGYDSVDSGPLVKITGGKPEVHRGFARNDNGGTDLRWRPLWQEGWTADVRIRWDLDQFAASDVFNLLTRAGLQVGIGEGRPGSPNSNGLGWGLFEVLPTAVIGSKSKH